MNVLGMQIGKGWGKRVYKRERRDALLFIFKFNRRYIWKTGNQDYIWEHGSNSHVGENFD